MFSWSKSRSAKVITYPPLVAGWTVYAIGDIHGRLDLLERVQADIDTDTASRGGEILEIYLGDYVDRGPRSREVVDLLIERTHSHRVVLLRGNHEVLFAEFLAGRLDPQAWRRAGGWETLMSYGFDVGALAGGEPAAWTEMAERLVPANHRAFLDVLQDSFSIGEYFFTHAGVRPGVPLERQNPKDLNWIREEFLSDRRDHGAIVVHGHSAGHSAEFHSNRINIDSGAYATNRLSCLIIDAEGPRLLDAEGGA